MKTFQPKLFMLGKQYSVSKLINDIVAGIIVAIIALPLSIALAIASGVSPEQIAVQKIDAVWIMNLTVQRNRIVCGHTVFRNENRKLVAFVEKLCKLCRIALRRCHFKLIVEVKNDARLCCV